MMKKIVFLISFLLLIFLNLFSQNIDKNIYKDYGTWEIKNGNNKIVISTYITIEKDIKKENNNIFKYDLYLKSESIYNNNVTKTWLYGTKIYIDGIEVTSDQFLEGFTILIPTQSERIYSYTTNKKNINFSITWKKSIYESRIKQ